jgi:hypothetical protein
MKTLLIATLLMTTIAHAGWYNVHTAQERGNLPPSLSVDGGILTNPTQADYRAAGWLVLIPFETPAGYVRVDGTRRIDVTDAGAYEVWDVETIQTHEAKRIAALLPAYGERVGVLVALLEKFGITMPTTQADATPIIYAGAKTDPALNPDALLVLTVYQGLRSDLSDADIYAISEAIKP